MNVPILTAQPNTNEQQAKGGLQITLTPVAYEAVVREETHLDVTDTLFPIEGEIYCEKTTSSVADVNPDRLGFLLTINNVSPRVFHGSGIAAQLNVGGRVIASTDADFGDLTNAVIPPHQQAQFTITGPPLSVLGEKNRFVGVLLDDVKTEQNAAAAKEKFEWYFDYTMAPRQVTLPPASRNGVYLTPDEYQQAVAPSAMTVSDAVAAGGVAVTVEPPIELQVLVFDPGFPPGCYVYEGYYYYRGYRFEQAAFRRYAERNLREHRFVHPETNRKEAVKHQQARQNAAVQAQNARQSHSGGGGNSKQKK
jgi:hypothetical protein